MQQQTAKFARCYGFANLRERLFLRGAELKFKRGLARFELRGGKTLRLIHQFNQAATH